MSAGLASPRWWVSLLAGSRVLAIAGGILLLAIAATVTLSVTLRSDWIGGRGVPGDFELVQMGTAACAFAFLPLCQAQRGHIFVDSFTGWLPSIITRGLDAFWDAVQGVAMAIIAWRLGVGALGEFASGTTTMVLGIPTGYVITLCSLLAAFLSLVAWASAFVRFQDQP